jgi:hypothetical protein
MKEFTNKNLLRIIAGVWLLIVILDFIFDWFDDVKSQHTIVMWTIFVVGSIIYNKLDKIEKSL